MIQCPSCARQQSPGLTCRGCGAPLAVYLDYFTALGLPRKLTIDLHALETAYHELGRRVHPDRFASDPARVRSASLVAMALLTSSYRELRDPVRRGRYWLELNGEKLAENNRQVPPDLLETVFEVQEQLDELRATACAGSAMELGREVENRRLELVRMHGAVLAGLDVNFARWDASDGSDRAALAALAAELKGILSRIAYLRTLIRDVDRALESRGAAAAGGAGRVHDNV